MALPWLLIRYGNIHGTGPAGVRSMLAFWAGGAEAPTGVTPTPVTVQERVDPGGYARKRGGIPHPTLDEAYAEHYRRSREQIGPQPEEAPPRKIVPPASVAVPVPTPAVAPAIDIKVPPAPPAPAVTVASTLAPLLMDGRLVGIRAPAIKEQILQDDEDAIVAILAAIAGH